MVILLLCFKWISLFFFFFTLKDYEDDFEEIDESTNEGEDKKETELPEVGEEREELTPQRRKEIEAIQRAMDEENERSGTAQSRQNTSREEEDKLKRHRGTVLIYSLSFCYINCKTSIYYRCILFKIMGLMLFFITICIDSEMIQSRGSQHGRFIDFVAAKQREFSKKVATKQK